MKHEEIKARIGAFIDNELKEEQKIEIGAHLLACPECSAETEAIKRQDSLMKERHEISVSGRFRSKVKAAITQSHRKTSGLVL